MAKIEDDNARITFLRSYANELANGYKVVTVHFVVRDNRNNFFFVENLTPKSPSLNYKVINSNTILLTDYPNKLDNNEPNLDYYFSTDIEPTKDYNEFDLFIQFFTKDINTGKKALTFRGIRSTIIPQSEKAETPSANEIATETGIVYFPDVT